eukprot:CAMPEP_0175716906 /NCGR_PEP_ID=MMETSP0097-20121207/43387_1 /TAXON_ID=311494 /ORGANISM="Alexandrium monilatum, Strain CCMP3105" /LENGTH=94 /DNA_ID=CAMNT_0017024467 /DNA_START=170 /DNA_END=451 /DNA_ORIENTATION=-
MKTGATRTIEPVITVHRTLPPSHQAVVTNFVIRVRAFFIRGAARTSSSLDIIIPICSGERGRQALREGAGAEVCAGGHALAQPRVGTSGVGLSQ